MKKHCFTYKNRTLYCENTSLLEIAEEVGTPFYVYSRKRLDENLYRVNQALAGTDSLICYALKANNNPVLLSLLARTGCGAEVVSAGELSLALASGFPAGRIVFSGVGKTDREIEKAIDSEILAINVESFEELRVIGDIAGAKGKTAPVAIRVNPDIDAKTHPFISTALRNNKFGIEIARAPEAFRLAASIPALQIRGLHCHLGSMLMDLSPYREAARSLCKLIHEIRKSGIHLEHVDIGGGLGVAYHDIVAGIPDGSTDHPDPPSPEDLFSAILPLFRDLNIRLVFEPGRYLIADTGALITRVVITKTNGNRKFLIIDAGMNDLIRPSLYEAYHQIVPVAMENRDTERVTVAGPICESTDFFANDRQLPKMKRGGLLAVMAAGAYGYSLTSNYNGRLRPPEVLVEGDSYRIIRRREPIEALWYLADNTN